MVANFLFSSLLPSSTAGDLFDMLLPMLSIYQEYVRNHHYSLQVLTECKSRPEFSIVLRRLESKPICKGRSLEVSLSVRINATDLGDDKLIITIIFFWIFYFLILLTQSFLTYPMHQVSSHTALFFLDNDCGHYRRYK